MTQLSIFWHQTRPSVQRHNKNLIELISRNKKVVDNTPRLAVRNQLAKIVIKREWRYDFFDSNTTVDRDNEGVIYDEMDI